MLVQHAPFMYVIGYAVVASFLIENTVLISARFLFFSLPPLHFNLLLVSCPYGNRQPGIFGKQIDVSILCRW